MFFPYPSTNIHRILRFFQISNGISLVATTHRGLMHEIGFAIQAEDSPAAQQKLDKFHNFLKISLDDKIEIVITGRIHGDVDTFFHHDVDMNNLIEKVSKDSFDKYIQSSNTSEDLFIESINDFHDRDMVNAVTKIINYLEGTLVGKQFKDLRNAMSHREVTVAKNKVEKQFPGEFEFDGNEFIRKSEKNRKSLRNYWPELLDASRKKFYQTLIAEGKNST